MKTEPLTFDEIELASQPIARRIAIWWSILIVALPLAVVDVAVVPLMDKIQPDDAASVFVYTCFGLIPAQAALLTVGLVFGSGPLWQRLLIHWASALLLTFAWFLGFSGSFQGNAFSDRKWQEAMRGVCVLPIISLTIQAPLWMIRCFFGWRFVQPSRLPLEDASPDANLTIRDLMLATVVVALSLTISRLAPIPDHLKVQPQTFWLAVAGFAGAAAGVSALGVLPLLAIFFSKLPLGLAWVLGIGYALGYGVLLLLFVASGILGLPILETPQIIGLAAVLIAFSSGTAAGLTLLRINRVAFVRT
jgi:hypothetical protein